MGIECVQLDQKHGVPVEAITSLCVARVGTWELRLITALKVLFVLKQISLFWVSYVLCLKFLQTGEYNYFLAQILAVLLVIVVFQGLDRLFIWGSGKVLENSQYLFFHIKGNLDDLVKGTTDNSAISWLRKKLKVQVRTLDKAKEKLGGAKITKFGLTIHAMGTKAADRLLCLSDTDGGFYIAFPNNHSIVEPVMLLVHDADIAASEVAH